MKYLVACQETERDEYDEMFFTYHLSGLKDLRWKNDRNYFNKVTLNNYFLTQSHYEEWTFYINIPLFKELQEMGYQALTVNESFKQPDILQIDRVRMFGHMI